MEGSMNSENNNNKNDWNLTKEDMSTYLSGPRSHSRSRGNECFESVWSKMPSVAELAIGTADRRMNSGGGC